MRIKASKKREDEPCGGTYRVQLYSRRASLVQEFCLDTQENDIADLESPEKLLREALTPYDFETATVTLTSEDGTSEQRIVQFDPRD